MTEESSPTTEPDHDPDPPKEAPMTAKQKAEERRRKILERGSQRMNLVSGNVPTSNTTTREDNDPADDSADAVATTESKEEEELESENADTAANPPAPVEEKAKKSSGSSKLAAMRRRRFKKATPAVTPVSDSSTPSSTTATTTTESEPSTSEPEKETKKVEDPSPEESTTVPSSSSSTAPSDDTGENSGTKKKYMGVAKMRRKRLAEKKAADEETSSSTAPATRGLVDSRSSSKPNKRMVVLQKAMRFRVFMQFISVLMLFLPGFFVGVFNSPTRKAATAGVTASSRGLAEGNGVKIHKGIFPLERGLNGYLHLIGVGTGEEGEDMNKIASMRSRIERKLYGTSDDTEQLEMDENAKEEDDEFGSGDSSENGQPRAPHREPNIDPLFRMDLDELTSGPGIIMYFARWAVSFHRLLISFFFLRPMSMFAFLLTVPKLLLASPPVLFLAAISARVVGRHGLGAELPELDEAGDLSRDVGGQGAGDGSGAGAGGGKDIISMFTKTAKDFVKNSFPRLTVALKLFMDARRDLYVVLCGLFIGLIVPIPDSLMSIIGGTGGTEEL